MFSRRGLEMLMGRLKRMDLFEVGFLTAFQSSNPEEQRLALFRRGVHLSSKIANLFASDMQLTFERFDFRDSRSQGCGQFGSLGYGHFRSLQ